MQFLLSLRLRVRLQLGFGIVLLAVLAMAVASSLKLIDLRGQIDAIGTQVFDRSVRLSALERSLSARDIALRDLASQDDITAVVVDIKKFKAARDQYKTLYADLIKELGNDKEGLAIATSLDGINTEMQKVVDEVLNHAMSANSPDAVKVVREKMLPLQLRMTAVLDQMRESLSRQKTDAVQTGSDRANAGIRMIVALGAVSLLIGIGLSFMIGRSVVLPLKDVVKVVKVIATGDLTRELRVVGRDETAELMQAIKQMQEGLRELVGDVISASREIDQAASEVSHGNNDLAERTEQQASSLEQTASSIAQVASSMSNSSEAALQADKEASVASTAAARGSAAVADVVTTMTRIQESSRRIGDITAVVDGIAFQTNILALNAAVEAARAGEQGRGFAVVATEVRALAQRSAAAAKEIKTLIGASVECVETGSLQVSQAGTTMDEILKSIQHVTSLMGQINAASQSQGNSVQQINQAITHMEQMTHQNAALVEESAAASESLRSQASRMVEMVGNFKTQVG